MEEINAKNKFRSAKAQIAKLKRENPEANISYYVKGSLFGKEYNYEELCNVNIEKEVGIPIELTYIIVNGKAKNIDLWTPRDISSLMFHTREGISSKEEDEDVFIESVPETKPVFDFDFKKLAETIKNEVLESLESEREQEPEEAIEEIKAIESETMEERITNRYIKQLEQEIRELKREKREYQDKERESVLKNMELSVRLSDSLRYESLYKTTLSELSTAKAELEKIKSNEIQDYNSKIKSFIDMQRLSNESILENELVSHKKILKKQLEIEKGNPNNQMNEFIMTQMQEQLPRLFPLAEQAIRGWVTNKFGTNSEPSPIDTSGLLKGLIKPQT